MSIRPTFMGFETSKRGLQINQKALDIVSHNITNIGVTGYTRQRVDQVSLHMHGVRSRYSDNKVNMSGQGAAISGIAQLRDPYLDKRFRQENSDMGFYGKASNILTDIETSLDEYGANGLKSAITQMYNAASTLHANINSTNANILKTSAKSVANILQQFDKKLNDITNQQRQDLEIGMNRVNTILEQIQSLNESIARDVFVAEGINNNYYGPSELIDQRNVLLDELSQYGDIKVNQKPGNMLEVYFGEDLAVSVNSDTGESAARKLTFFVDPMTNETQVKWADSGKGITTKSGSMLSSLNMLNGTGPYDINGVKNVERGIPYYRHQMDVFATRFADVFNSTIPAYDQDGKVIPGQYLTLFSRDDMDGDVRTGINAGNIQVSEQWNNNSDYILNAKNEDGKYDNTYYQALLNNFTKDFSFGDFTDEFVGTFEGFVKNYTTTLGEDIVFNKSRLQASETVANSVLDSIQDVSGVSIDEEGSDMMMYQKILAAMSRIMTTYDDALDTIINKMGTVGR